MNYRQRAFLYLWRKKSKSILLFSILLVISTMLLSATMILQTAQATSRSLQEKAKAKLVLDADDKSLITPDMTAQLIACKDVASINRAASHTAYPADFSPVTGSASPEDANAMITLHAYDNTETDGVFAEEKYRLLEGNAIDSQHPHGILINTLLAAENVLSLGDTLCFKTDDERKASGTIIGIFSSGVEYRQEASVLAAYRIENQLFCDHSLYEALFGTQGYSSVSVFTANPAHMEQLYSTLSQIVGNGISITTSDALYAQLQAPLQQVCQITALMLALTLLTAIIVVSLLLCMWMRTRQKEFAILISLGESRLHLLLQAAMEGITLLWLSIIGAACCAGIFSNRMINQLFSSLDFAGMSELHVRWEHLVSLTAMGGAVVLAAIGISILPTLRANPKDILSGMEG